MFVVFKIHDILEIEELTQLIFATSQFVLYIKLFIF